MSTLIIIPTLNERDNVARLVPEIFSRCPGVAVLIVDDASRDGTADEARRRGAHVIERVANPGYGASVLDGFRWAGEHGYHRVITMDADFSHDPARLPAVIFMLEKADAVIGSRYTAGGGIANWDWHRRLLSKFSNWYVRAILRLPIADSTTGFVGYRRDAIMYLAEHVPHSEGYAFLVECKYRLARAGFRMREIPITYTERREGKSKMSWSNIWEAIWMPWRLRRK